MLLSSSFQFAGLCYIHFRARHCYWPWRRSIGGEAPEDKINASRLCMRVRMANWPTGLDAQFEKVANVLKKKGERDVM